MKCTKTANVLKLTDNSKKVLLIYMFNVSCKTNLSNQHRYIVVARNAQDKKADQNCVKFLNNESFIKYSFSSDNAFTAYAKPELVVRPNSFTNFVFNDQGKGFDSNTSIHRYTMETITIIWFRYQYEKLVNFFGCRRWRKLTVNFLKEIIHLQTKLFVRLVIAAHLLYS